jgi:hypothetical protein
MLYLNLNAFLIKAKALALAKASDTLIKALHCHRRFAMRGKQQQKQFKC